MRNIDPSIALTEASELMAEYLAGANEMPSTWARQLALMSVLVTFHGMAITWSEPTFSEQCQAMGPMVRAVFELGRAFGKVEG